MNAIKFYLIFLLFSKVSEAQETYPSFELGTNIISFSTYHNYFLLDQQQICYQIMNGFSIKYNKQKSSIRGNISFIKDHRLIEPPDGQSEFYSAEFYSNDFRIGLGVQHNLLKSKNWFYWFVDLGYRRITSIGYLVEIYPNYWGGQNYNETYKFNFLDVLTGIGFKLKILKHLFFSTELGFNHGVGRGTYQMSFISKYAPIQGEHLYFSPTLRFQLSVKLH